MKHGGKREGAGRKPKDGVKRIGFFVKLSAETIKKMKREKDRLSYSAYLDEAVKAFRR